MRANFMAVMRPAAALSLAATVALAAITQPAAAADATVAPQPAAGYDHEHYGPYDYYGYYRPACPYRYEYGCRYDAAGNAYCTCWPGAGFYLFGND